MDIVATDVVGSADPSQGYRGELTLQQQKIKGGEGKQLSNKNDYQSEA